jgi:hypothetical protein
VKINEGQTTRHTDHGQVQFIGEASMLGLRPGEWPEDIEMEFDAAESVTFQRARAIGHEDLMAMVYVEFMTGDYMQLHVLND